MVFCVAGYSSSDEDELMAAFDWILGYLIHLCWHRASSESYYTGETELILAPLSLSRTSCNKILRLARSVVGVYAHGSRVQTECGNRRTTTLPSQKVKAIYYVI